MAGNDAVMWQTSFNIHALNQGGLIIIIYDISLLQFLYSAKNTVIWKKWVTAITLIGKEPFIK